MEATGTVGRQKLGFSSEEWERRHRKIREVMQLRNIDCLVVVGCSAKNWAYSASHMYVAGQDMVGLGDYAYVIFPMEGEPIQLQSPATGTGEVWVDDRLPVPTVLDPVFKKGKGEGQRIKDYAWGIVRAVERLGLQRATIGIADMRVMPAGVYVDIQRDLPQATFIPAGDLLLEVRRIKSPEEIAYTYTAAEAADQGIEAIIEAATRPGVTLGDLQRAARIGMLVGGATAADFAIVSVGSWEERIHGDRSVGDPQRAVKRGDLIFNELCPGCHGSYVQVCHPICVGMAEDALPSAFRDTMRLHRDIYELAKAELRPGNTVLEIEKKAASCASARGMSGKVWTLQVSEMAEDHYKLTYTELQPRMIYANHPHISPGDGEMGYRGIMLGNTLIVTENEAAATSRLSLDLTVV